MVQQLQRIREKTEPLTWHTLTQIWLVGYWSKPLAKASYATPSPLYHFTAILTGMIGSNTKWIEKIALLPPELSQIIAAHSPSAALWRLLAALRWQSDGLIDSNAVTLSLSDLGTVWRRGQFLQPSPTVKLPLVRFTIDHDGVLAMDLLTSVPKAPSYQTRGFWYLLEELCRLGDLSLRLQEERGLLRLQTKGLILWDVPNPPAWDLCQFYGSGHERPLRIRSISFESITDLTVFCAAGSIYGIHAHRGNSSALESFSRLSPRLQQNVAWLYFPLSQGEFIQDIWVRSIGERMNFSLIVI